MTDTVRTGASAGARPRPLSPHLSIWKWGPHMLVSILNRACGVVMATMGALVFVWWLVALAAGPEAYGTFHSWVIDARDTDAGAHVVNILARIVAIGLSWALFQHMANGVRHFVMDLGAGYELRANKAGAIATMVFSAAATLVLWAYLFFGRG